VKLRDDAWSARHGALAKRIVGLEVVPHVEPDPILETRKGLILALPTTIKVKGQCE
jgi:hypothetical protein